jgi:hypothetical protein
MSRFCVSMMRPSISPSPGVIPSPTAVNTSRCPPSSGSSVTPDRSRALCTAARYALNRGAGPGYLHSAPARLPSKSVVHSALAVIRPPLWCFCSSSPGAGRRGSRWFPFGIRPAVCVDVVFQVNFFYRSNECAGRYYYSVAYRDRIRRADCRRAGEGAFSDRSSPILISVIFIIHLKVFLRYSFPLPRQPTTIMFLRRIRLAKAVSFREGRARP